MKAYALVFKVICWLAIGGFVAATIGVRSRMAEMSQTASLIICGNYVTDSLSFALGVGAPVALAAVAGLGVLWRRGRGAGWPLVPAGLLVVAGTIFLLVAGVGFFRAALPGFRLSEIVWWMRPMGGWLGV